MMKPNFIFLICTILIISINLSAQVKTREIATGNWSGKIAVGAVQLEVIFKINSDSTGQLTTKMDVPMQNAKDLPVNKTVITSDSMNLTIAMIMGNFKGKFVNDSTVEGSWTQRGNSLPLTLKKSGSIKPLNRPQTPKPPFPYKSEDITYTNKASGLKLAGTLTIPENANKCTAVILITGSGAQDRNETIFGHKPFWVIADYLTRNGIAVLRVDDRGVGGSERGSGKATSEDFAGDVKASIEFLKTRSEIDPKKIGLIGHSEGGLIAPIVATQTKDVAFVVLLAGPGITGEEIIYQQIALLSKTAGISDEQIAKSLEMEKSIIETLKTEPDSVRCTEKIREFMTEGKYETLKTSEKQAVDIQIAQVNNAWFRFFISYDPAPILSKVKCPVLALNGEKDLQVPAKTNLPAIERALVKGKNKNFKTMEFPGLNHLFQNCKTGAVNEYGEIEETISPKVLEIIRDWIVNVKLKN